VKTDTYKNQREISREITYPRSVAGACCVVVRVRWGPFARWRPGAMARRNRRKRREGGREGGREGL